MKIRGSIGRRTLRLVFCSAIMLALLPAVVMAAGGQEAGGSKAAAGKGPLEIRAMLIQYLQPPDEKGPFWAEMEKKFNVDYTIDWVPSDGYEDKLALVLTSGDLPDIVQIPNMTAPTIMQAAKAGVFADLTPVLADFKDWPNLGKINPDAWKNSKAYGKNFVYPRSRGHYNMAWFVRGDWVKKLGREMPDTTEEFASLMKEIAKSDLDGNGAIDTIPLTQINYDWQQAFGPGTKVPVRSADGGILHHTLAESYALLLDFYRDLYASGAMAKEYALMKETQRAEMFYVGKAATFYKNSWHRFRLTGEIQKHDPKGTADYITYLKGPGGYGFQYDIGYFGGLAVSAKVSKDKLMAITAFMDQTSAEENYYFCTYGREGIDWNMVDGFPNLTESGAKEVTNSFYCPYTLATNDWMKVDSPLAPNAYNVASREMMKEIDKVASNYPSAVNMFAIINSDSWSKFWSRTQAEFKAFEVDVVSGAKTVDQFRAYQKELMKDPDVKASFKEFQRSYEEYEFPKQ